MIDGTTSVSGSAHPLNALAAAGAAQERERFVLLDAVPQQVYGRMRMCRAMVNDHFTPAYLAAMTSAVARFEAGYPAERVRFDGPNAPEGSAQATAGGGADALNSGQAFSALERSTGGAQPSAAARRTTSGLAADTGGHVGGHAKAA